MSKVRIDLCAEGVPLAQIRTERDWSAYTRLVDLNDQELFGRAILFYLGGAHGIMSHAQFAGMVFTVEVEGEFTEEESKQLDANFLFVSELLRTTLGDSGYTVDLAGWHVIATPLKKH